MKVRSDAWTHEDDLLLAETVLRYIREGGTQLQAFEEVGDKLNRTSAACGFRWNAEIRRQYEQAIQIAKKQRKERKRALANSTPAGQKYESTTRVQQNQVARPTQSPAPAVAMKQEMAEEFTPVSTTNMTRMNKSLSLDDVISFLVQYKQQGSQGTQVKLENDRLKLENNELKKKNEELQHKVEKLTKEHSTIQEDYQALVQIMDRARRMVMFEETEERQAPVFRMDKNGNLEKVAK
ncbi:RsfA family transcriptional regulator [Bacillus suaedaesalsae]|uniref:RsfA family transcriptional regulator n=1 Tax=Bacillus suaedaesalsae TaxID=2810349 RepID=A0ABS2DMG2_9BACI|nr:RsfA family transcriptional regulator [Bacillus suaedaesalsae]MBM6619700.1 RsfA family transcriptional regulator [Bacillus suaedaesalsae]